MAAPTYVGIDSAPEDDGSNSNNMSFEWASVTGEADDDIAFFAIYRETTAAYTATPAGWSQAGGFPVNVSTGGTFRYQADLWLRRHAGETDTAAATWSWSGFAWRFGKGVVYRNLLNTGNPVPTVLAETEAAQNDQPSHPGITIARSNSGLVWIIWNFAQTPLTAFPAGMTERKDASELDAEIKWVDDLTMSTGATGALSATLTNPEYVFSYALEIATEAAGAATAVKDLIGPGLLAFPR